MFFVDMKEDAIYLGGIMKRKKAVKFWITGMAGFIVCLSGCGMFPSDTGPDMSAVSVEEGDHIHMGSWHDEEIEWRVLDIEGNQVLLLSEYVLDVQPYHDVPCDSILWEDCTLRQWLNSTFYEGAFTDEEREQIILSWSGGLIKSGLMIVQNPADAYLEREAEDYIFLLSNREISEYFKTGTLREDMGIPDAYGSPSKYVKNNCDIQIYSQGDKDYCGWWLSGGTQTPDDLIWPGMITEFSNYSVVSPEEIVYSGVRPAMWITWQEE